MYQYVKINGGKIMRKLSTKVRRVLVLTAMFVVMASIPVMAAIEYHDYMDTELTVYRANGEKRCVAVSYTHLDVYKRQPTQRNILHSSPEKDYGIWR